MNRTQPDACLRSVASRMRSPQVLFRLCEGAVGNRHLPVPVSQGGGIPSVLPPQALDKALGLMMHVIIGPADVRRPAPLPLRHGLPLRLVEHLSAYVLHASSYEGCLVKGIRRAWGATVHPYSGSKPTKLGQRDGRLSSRASKAKDMTCRLLGTVHFGR